jgi:hypothetical protein
MSCIVKPNLLISPTIRSTVRDPVLRLSEAVFLKQRSTEHRWGLRQKQWNKYLTILKYRKKL